MTAAATAPLPFRGSAAIAEQGGAIVDAQIPCSIWQTPGRNTSAGRAYDHEGEAPLEFVEQLQASNRKLVAGGVTYAIVQATPYDVIPHVALRLRRVETSGAG